MEMSLKWSGRPLSNGLLLGFWVWYSLVGVPSWNESFWVWQKWLIKQRAMFERVKKIQQERRQNEYERYYQWKMSKCAEHWEISTMLAWSWARGPGKCAWSSFWIWEVKPSMSYTGRKVSSVETSEIHAWWRWRHITGYSRWWSKIGGKSGSFPNLFFIRKIIIFIAFGIWSYIWGSGR